MPDHLPALRFITKQHFVHRGIYTDDLNGPDACPLRPGRRRRPAVVPPGRLRHLARKQRHGGDATGGGGAGQQWRNGNLLLLHRPASGRWRWAASRVRLGRSGSSAGEGWHCNLHGAVAYRAGAKDSLASGRCCNPQTPQNCLTRTPPTRQAHELPTPPWTRLTPLTRVACRSPTAPSQTTLRPETGACFGCGARCLSWTWGRAADWTTTPPR